MSLAQPGGRTTRSSAARRVLGESRYRAAARHRLGGGINYALTMRCHELIDAVAALVGGAAQAARHRRTGSVSR